MYIYIYTYIYIYIYIYTYIYMHPVCRSKKPLRAPSYSVSRSFQKITAMVQCLEMSPTIILPSGALEYAIRSGSLLMLKTHDFIVARWVYWRFCGSNLAFCWGIFKQWMSTRIFACKHFWGQPSQTMRTSNACLVLGLFTPNVILYPLVI